MEHHKLRSNYLCVSSLLVFRDSFLRPVCGGQRLEDNWGEIGPLDDFLDYFSVILDEIKNKRLN